MENKRILIVQTAFIGDVILITPLIRAVHRLNADASIDVLVVPAAVKLLENNPHIRTVIPFAKRNNAIISMLRMLHLLRNNKYSLVISPHSSGRTHLLLWLSGIPRRIGFNRSLFPGLLTDKIKHPDNMHKINKNLMLLKLLSPLDFPMQTELFPSVADIAKAKNLLSSLPARTTIAIAPGSIWATKCWQLESYTELCKELTARDYNIVLIGAEADKQKCSHIETALLLDAPYAAVLNLAGLTNLLESAAVIAQCQLMICNDSGALHIANAVQTRVYAIFGPTVQRIGYFPYRSGDIVFEVDLNCRPCGSHGANTCPLKHHNCMKLVSAEQVLNAVIASFPA
ncbi:MAG: lipopolysaccharide heptosyltransferase II [Candidatus Cloacimonetes bacterium HGW-Cloacimonetes-3]|jgi:heptosyltransferase-2|nr:MAG: lipopolysaccharide heptosyltransferase II [Candidatus Cloacimonetes bacterium HGW-Cloacimonetes-3]